MRMCPIGVIGEEIHQRVSIMSGTQVVHASIMKGSPDKLFQRELILRLVSIAPSWH